MTVCVEQVFFQNITVYGSPRDWSVTIKNSISSSQHLLDEERLLNEVIKAYKRAI